MEKTSEVLYTPYRSVVKIDDTQEDIIYLAAPDLRKGHALLVHVLEADLERGDIDNYKIAQLGQTGEQPMALGDIPDHFLVWEPDVPMIYNS